VRAAQGGDGGFAGTVTAVLLGLVVLVVGSLIVADAWAVADTKSATTEAARAAVRTYVEAPGATSALADATAAAGGVLAGLGRDPSLAKVQVLEGRFARCGRIAISVSYPAPAVALPLIGQLGVGETVRSVHSELVDPYRSGLSGTSACA